MTESRADKPADESSETGSTVSLVVAIVVLAALVGMLLLVRGPDDQDHAGVPWPTAAIALRA